MTHVRPTRTLILAAFLLATPAHAEDCRPPNVARAYVWAGKPYTSDLKCPHEGLCWLETTGGTGTVASVETICLTPEQEAEAKARTR